jgi:TonB-linked SusC/RagA family outer membrane protein
MTKQFILLWKEGTWRRTLSVLCILVCSLTAFAQNRVSGRVVDVSGETVAGANVVEKGTSNGIITDIDGRFTLSVGENAVLRISYVGYVTQEVAVANRTMLDVTLLEDAQALDEVVVVGYGTQKKAHLSGAVSVIPAKALANRPVTNANIALQGLAPNMNITRTSGVADAAPGINIRGFTSINGGEALILVDNVPTSAAEFSRINPSDIESVSVLRDAASAAIYGARAAFGVVLVTTKTAKSEKIQISADYTYGLRQFDNVPEVLVGAEYMRLANIVSKDPNRFNDAAIAYMEAREKDPSLPEILGPGRENGGINDRQINGGQWEYYGLYDWFDVMLRDVSPNQTANVRVSQKGEKLAYSASGGFYQEDGMLRYGNEQLKRFNFRGNATYDMTSRWKLGTNIVFNRKDFSSTMITDEGEFWFYRLHSAYPTQPIYNPDGTYTQDGGTSVGSAVSGGRSSAKTDETQLSFNTEYAILKDVWTVSGDATFKMTNYDRDQLTVPTTYNNRPGKPNKPGSSSILLERYYERTTDYNLYTNFNKTFAGKHSVSATLGYNQYHYIYNNFRATMLDPITESLPSIQLARNNLQRWQGIGELSLRGVFGRLNYIFDDRYIAEFIGRYDGSSRFPKGQRFGFFPSFSGAWVVSKEKFMESVNETIQLSNLKLRGSYGALGNQDLRDNYYPAYATMGLINQIGKIIDGSRPMAMGVPGATPGGLTWETARTINGGIDLGFLKGRLNMEFDIYTRYTDNMLTRSKQLPGVFGTGEPSANAADLKTKGWELTLGWRDAVQVGGSPLNYGVNFMLADNKTWITRFDNPNKNLGDYYEGQRLGEIWGYTTLGYFDSDAEAAAWADQSALGNSDNNYAFQAGDLKFKDENGDGKINNGNNSALDPGDMKVIGNNRERLPYSINLDADWKGFDLRLFFQGIGSRQVYPPPTGSGGIYFWGLHGVMWGNGNTKNMDRWTEENPSQDAYFPRIKTNGGSNGELSKPQTKYLQDASYLRLKNVVLGYTIPSQWSRKVKIDNLRIFFSGENIFTFHHIEVKGSDPEKFGDAQYYPFQRTFSFGLNLGF